MKFRFKLPALLTVFALLSLPVIVVGQLTIVGYDSTNPNGASGAASPNLNAAESASDVVASQYARGPGLVANQGITLNSSGWSTSSSLNLGSDDYLTWGWTTGAGTYDLENMTLQYDRSGSGPTRLAIAVSINGGGLQTVFSDSSVFIGDETHTIDLTSFDDVMSAEFRLFGYNASSAGGTLDIERFNADPDPSRAIVVRGFATAVPEPTTSLLLTGIGLTTIIRRRRRA
ncbi:MAG: hypothetical protein ACI87E_002912 [Mariniblastus sp.]|jgi:hypothetical protein